MISSLNLIESSSNNSFPIEINNLFPKEFKFNFIKLINSNSKINLIVNQSLIHLQDPNQPPLILHSFKYLTSTSTSRPITSTPPILPTTTTTTATTTTKLSNIKLKLPNPIPSKHEKKSNSSSSSNSDLNSLPKLISILEIIKRSYLPPFVKLTSGVGEKVGEVVDKGKGKGKGKELELESEVEREIEREREGMMEGIEQVVDSRKEVDIDAEGIIKDKELPKEKHKRTRKTHRTGIHQYTLVGALESLVGGGGGLMMDSDDEEEEGGNEEIERNRQDEIVKDWLEGGSKGTKRPRRKHTPYMIVVLSTHALPELMRSKRFTHQAPLPLSKNLKPVTASISNKILKEVIEKKEKKVKDFKLGDTLKTKRKRKNKKGGGKKVVEGEKVVERGEEGEGEQMVE